MTIGTWVLLGRSYGRYLEWRRTANGLRMSTRRQPAVDPEWGANHGATQDRDFDGSRLRGGTRRGVCDLRRRTARGHGSAAPVAADADVQAALTRSCYGCHAESGALPWQAKLAPSAWFAGSAREKLDFSTFHALSADRRSEALRAIERVVSSGEMPPWDSALFDGTEKLTPAEKERVASWASAAERGTAP